MRVAVMLTTCLVVGACKNAPVNAVCASTAECQGGLVCRNARCLECQADAECGVNGTCGLTVAGRCGCPDRDNDGVGCGDCNDADPSVFPGANEICDGKDNNCDGVVDEGVLTTWYLDADGDGFGNPGLSLTRCVAPVGYVDRGGDCNDQDPLSYPGRPEVCDGRDNNCNGVIDEGVKTVFYRDADGDGFGDPNNSVSVCQLPASGFVTVAGDCDDTRADANPAAKETCNDRDDDCDGVVDGITRSCSTDCGTGLEACAAGLWQGCTAPPVTTVVSNLTLTSDSTFACLLVDLSAKVRVEPGVTLAAQNWVRLKGSSVLELAPRAQVVTKGDFSLADQASLLASDSSLSSGGTIEIGSASKVYLQWNQAQAYSSGGSAACSPLVAGHSVSGAGGGARGGRGGQGATCNQLVTVPLGAATGPAAVNGADACGCDCDAGVPGASPTGGWGAAPMAGGGGGASAGTGGRGAGGRIAGVATQAAPGGVAELYPAEPLYGGGGGGSSGSLDLPYPPQACQGAGGPGGGLLRLSALRFSNKGVLLGNGTPGEDRLGFYALGGGGGGGGGGTWVFKVDLFDNEGAISATGGRGGDAVSAIGVARLGGGGGGGGGGWIFLEARDGGSALLVSKGTVLVGGGAGGVGAAGDGAPGSDGVVFVR